jgi:hypothetical protein
MVPPPFQPEGTTLPNAVPLHFERFYRARLRRVIGIRSRSSTVQAAYVAWATGEAAPSISYHQLRRYMLALGHPHIKSNGIQYLDVAFAADVPNVEDTFAVMPIGSGSPGGIDATVSAIDSAVSALAQLRRVLTGAA